jgi:hypothetical protein
VIKVNWALEKQMISTFVSFTVPSAVISGIASGGLLIFLIAAQMLDSERSALKQSVRQIMVFATPLLVFFAFSVIIFLFHALTNS